MDPHWAADNLQVIRTLMERSALYRRALAPIMVYTGLLGLAAGVAGHVLGLTAPGGFAAYWLAVAVVALSGSFVLARRQAIRDAEPFWSPPTRRVAQALAPPLAAGGMAGVLVWIRAWEPATDWLPAVWMVFYGCALASAGFFMQRGIKLVGWLFVLFGTLLIGLETARNGLGVPPHWVMGGVFGGAHLGYGIYLRFAGKDGE